ncbi:MAG: NADH-quinone oxidoreductase subunit L, partial [Pontibacter sp.]|nr:NADH-quinone oxidoreductase subunit L [Pontibacter sp.]
MENLIWLIPALPFFGAFLLILFGLKMPRALVPVIGAGSVGISALLTILLGVQFLSEGATLYTQQVWQWFSIGGFSPGIAFHVDALTMVFIFVITFVGFLIHLYSAEFMAEDDDYSRFFASMNLFVCAMLLLVMADNLVLLYLGWEGVGLCSFLLIGFWYREPANGYAARKAFIITRIGDTAMAIGLFLLFQYFGTLNIQEILTQAPQTWSVGSQTAVLVALLLVGGAVGKSAQLPLQTWLPDAMAGPSPVSALIHAATMVTAGVYLIARTYVLFELAPIAQFTVGAIGAATLLIAGFTALTQNDLKRVLAYSTISQIGYMFLALGVGAWSAAVFHFMIHAFFKALLFLGAGAVIMALHHEHDMFKMGGLRHKMPVVFWTFLIGSASLAAVPLISAGFYSKDQILW